MEIKINPINKETFNFRKKCALILKSILINKKQFKKII